VVARSVFVSALPRRPRRDRASVREIDAVALLVADDRRGIPISRPGCAFEMAYGQVGMPTMQKRLAEADFTSAPRRTPATCVRQAEGGCRLTLVAWSEPRTTFHGERFNSEESILNKARPALGGRWPRRQCLNPLCHLLPIVHVPVLRRHQQVPLRSSRSHRPAPTARRDQSHPTGTLMAIVKSAPGRACAGADRPVRIASANTMASHSGCPWCGLPGGGRFVAEPDREAVARAQAGVISGPIRYLALPLRNVVATISIGLERHGGFSDRNREGSPTRPNLQRPQPVLCNHAPGSR
jgi:hypothetical protein